MSTRIAAPSREMVARRARTFLDRHAAMVPTFAALVIFVALLIGAQIHFGNFLTPRNMSALLLDNAYLLILAVGMTFVIVTGGIDLSVGSVMAFTGIWCAHLLAEGHSAVLVVPLIILGGAVIGLLIGVLIIQTLKSTILFLGVSSAQSPVFFAAVVILVVLIQSPRVHRLARGLTGGVRTPQAPAQSDAEVPA